LLGKSPPPCRQDTRSMRINWVGSSPVSLNKNASSGVHTNRSDTRPARIRPDPLRRPVNDA
jgi:hypothetical protein